MFFFLNWSNCALGLSKSTRGQIADPYQIQHLYKTLCEVLDMLTPLYHININGDLWFLRLIASFLSWVGEPSPNKKKREKTLLLCGLLGVQTLQIMREDFPSLLKCRNSEESRECCKWIRIENVRAWESATQLFRKYIKLDNWMCKWIHLNFHVHYRLYRFFRYMSAQEPTILLWLGWDMAVSEVGRAHLGFQPIPL